MQPGFAVTKLLLQLKYRSRLRSAIPNRQYLLLTVDLSGFVTVVTITPANVSQDTPYVFAILTSSIDLIGFCNS